MRKDNFCERICCLTLLLFTCSILVKAQYTIEVLDSGTFQLGEGVVLHQTSFRGLSVVNDETIWVSGSRGTIARSIDGGKTFIYKQLKGYEKSDFRDIEAFDKNTAIVMSSGTPALILKTVDGGETWKEVFRKNDSAYFLDAMDFWDNKRGMLVGDPINNHFVLLQTKDGGETWQELDTTLTPKAMDGEAVFAASGTSLRCWGKNEYGFVTGGRKARLLFNYEYDPVEPNQRKFQWLEKKINIQKGTPSQGVFSFSLIDIKDIGFILVGGDYVTDFSGQTNSSMVYLRSNHHYDGFIDTKSYKSCAETFINSTRDKDRRAIAVGTKGVDVFKYFEWQTISSEPFHVVRKAKKGKAVFLAGPKGKIGKLVQ